MYHTIVSLPFLKLAPVTVWNIRHCLLHHYPMSTFFKASSKYKVQGSSTLGVKSKRSIRDMVQREAWMKARNSEWVGEKGPKWMVLTYGRDTAEIKTTQIPRRHHADTTRRAYVTYVCQQINLYVQRLIFLAVVARLPCLDVWVPVKIMCPSCCWLYLYIMGIRELLIV